MSFCALRHIGFLVFSACSMLAGISCVRRPLVEEEDTPSEYIYRVAKQEETTLSYDGSGIGAYRGVDLGLRNSNGESVLFCNVNLGAEQPWESGLFYAFADSVSRMEDSAEIPSFIWDDAPYHTGSYYNKNWSRYIPEAFPGFHAEGKPDGFSILLPEDDAACVELGRGWRVPTREDWMLLLDKDLVDRQWVSNYAGSGVDGYLFVGKGQYHNNEIFFPSAGRFFNSQYQFGGREGSYWTSEVYDYDPGFAYIIAFDEKGCGLEASFRCIGRTVRPVYITSLNTEWITE